MTKSPPCWRAYFVTGRLWAVPDDHEHVRVVLPCGLTEIGDDAMWQFGGVDCDGDVFASALLPFHDPCGSNFRAVGEDAEIRGFFARALDRNKGDGLTAYFRILSNLAELTSLVT